MEATEAPARIFASVEAGRERRLPPSVATISLSSGAGAFCVVTFLYRERPQRLMDRKVFALRAPIKVGRGLGLRPPGSGEPFSNAHPRQSGGGVATQGGWEAETTIGRDRPLHKGERACS